MLNILFTDPDQIEAVFLKVLTSNEIGEGLSKRGVIVPVGAYRFFPEFPGFTARPDRNYSLPLVGKGVVDGDEVSDPIAYKHYKRYPERRLTRLTSYLQGTVIGSVVLLGRRVDGHYEIVHLHPGDRRYQLLLESVGLTDAHPGNYYLDLTWQPDLRVERSPYEDELLRRFVAIRDRGFIPAISGATSAVGLTFENLMGIDPNNYPGPDFGDIEIKCHEMGVARDEEIDLFLKEPEWLDGLTHAQRIPCYGYRDEENNRYGLKCRVNRDVNNLDLQIRDDFNLRELRLDRSAIPVAKWDHETLDDRLLAKLTHAVSIGAKVQRSDSGKEFHYATITRLSSPSLGGFLELVESSRVWLELRMHIRDGESATNHGSQFRVRESRLDRLFNRVVAWQE